MFPLIPEMTDQTDIRNPPLIAKIDDEIASVGPDDGPSFRALRRTGARKGVRGQTVSKQAFVFLMSKNDRNIPISFFVFVSYVCFW